MTENHERAEQARFVFHIYGCNVQILPNATHAIQIIHQGDGTILRTESCITPAASGRHESQAPPLGKVRALNITSNPQLSSSASFLRLNVLSSLN